MAKGMTRPDRSRENSRQVTTATPAGLDFRATGVADEGCVDTMSTESPCSIAQVLSGLKPAIGIATRKRQGGQGICLMNVPRIETGNATLRRSQTTRRLESDYVVRDITSLGHCCTSQLTTQIRHPDHADVI